MTRYEPHDPATMTGIPSESDPLKDIWALDEAISVDDAIRLPAHIEAGYDVARIVAGEGKALVAQLASYGMETRLNRHLDTLIHDSDVLTVSFQDDTAPYAKAIEVSRVDNAVRVAVGARTLKAFVTDSMHSIQPVNGAEDICFARDTGVKMAYVFALSLGICEALGLGKSITATSQTPELQQLARSGAHELPLIGEKDYAQFLPYRLAARFTIDRLVELCRNFFDASPLAAEEVLSYYEEHRRRALNSASETVYGEVSMIDVASIAPLSVDATMSFVRGLAAALKSDGRLHLPM